MSLIPADLGCEVHCCARDTSGSTWRRGGAEDGAGASSVMVMCTSPPLLSTEEALLLAIQRQTAARNQNKEDEINKTGQPGRYLHAELSLDQPVLVFDALLR